MTREEILQEKKWLTTKANKSDPMYNSRRDEWYRQVDIYNKGLSDRAREATKSFQIGDVVYLPERYNKKGLWRVQKIMQKNILLIPIGESDFKGRLKCSAELLIKAEEEDKSLVDALDDIGLA